MNEDIKIMLEKLSQDEETQKKLATVRDPDEAYAIVSAIHGGYTKEEFIATMKGIAAMENTDLTADDLRKAAGGKDIYVPETDYFIVEGTNIVASPDYWEWWEISAVISSGIAIFGGGWAAAAT